MGNADESACEANTCICTNGVAKNGTLCTTDGVAMCTSCNVGFIKNAAETACDPPLFEEEDLDGTMTCDQQVRSGGKSHQVYKVELTGSTSGSLKLEYEMYQIKDEMKLFYENKMLFDTGGLVSGNAQITVNIDGTDKFVYIEMNAPTDGTLWRFKVDCVEAPLLSR